MIRGARETARMGAIMDEGARWDAQAEYDVGQLIARYLRERPPPDDASFSHDLHCWAQNLQRHGLARLRALGQPRLTVL